MADGQKCAAFAISQLFCHQAGFFNGLPGSAGHEPPRSPSAPRSTACAVPPVVDDRPTYNLTTMDVAILSARIGWHTDELCRAVAERGHSARVLPYEGLVAHLGSDRGAAGDLSCDRTSILDADAVLARIVPNGSLEQIIYRMDALHWIEQRGVPVMNSPRAIERSVDKFYTSALLQEAGLPTPETVVCESMADAMAAVRAMGDVILKPIFGSMGHGMVRVSDPEVAFRVLRTLEQLRPVFYVQRAVDHDGRDVRVFIIGGRVLGAIERRARPGEWRTNVSNGGLARPFDLPTAWAQLALRAAAAVGADYAGVDLLPARDGAVFVLEVNGIPGWQGLQRATGLDVAGAIIEHLIGRVQTGPPVTTAAVPLAAGKTSSA
jgi:RimK family alpha-L-glutamate ligase